ncbi:DICT sensory domain-containing protein [Myxacorys almedinensis]|uniref:histidine kinase n=1 Tax=Myxacorys almedinensis A TaxID=2690445 RepID=A0A8J8CM92_9CYAN|nr:DICT sensory domain-containing protein [Myxacorys almedinensis]NDJ18485.1 histidine kinase [Myxacorys almedinensis A]
MTSLIASAPSLYSLVADSAASPSALQISPVTFKSLMNSLLDVLVEEQIPAQIWAKLPRGDAWQIELDRYIKLADVAQGVYLFKNQRDEALEDSLSANHKSLSGSVDGGTQTISNQPLLHPSSPISIQLAADSPLRREYFLLIWSAQFCGVLVAHRSKIVVPSKADDLQTTFVPEEDATEKRPSLMTFLALEQATTRRAISALPISIDPALESFSSRWEAALAKVQPVQASSPFLEQLLIRQVQRQEDLWQRGSHYRRQAELANLLQLQNEELVSAIRLKDEFVHTVGQELRTPLTTMKTAITLLNSPSLKLPQRQRYMDLLVKECDRQTALISSLLDLVSLDQMADQASIQALKLMDIVPGVVSTYQPLAEEKGVRLAYTVPEHLPAIACLNTWLKQIVIHLLHNGIKFTPRGGQVWVRAKQQDDFVHLEFKDTGIGIPTNEIPRIFDRFYRVRQVVEDEIDGAGLGLTVVQQLLIHCGGSISVKSRMGEGSVFTVLLPIYKVTVERD